MRLLCSGSKIMI